MYRQLGLNNLPLEMGTPVGSPSPQAGISAAPAPTTMSQTEPAAPLAASMTMADRKNLITSMVQKGMSYQEVMSELTNMGIYDPGSPAPEAEVVEAFERPGFGTVIRQGAQQIGQDTATGVGTVLKAAGADEAGEAVTDAGQDLFGLTPEEEQNRQLAAQEDRYGRDVADAVVGSVPSFALIAAGSMTGAKVGSIAGPWGAAAGGAIGGIMTAIPMMIGSATEAAKANGHNVDDPRVQQEIIATGVGRAALESIGPSLVTGALRNTAKEVVQRRVAAGALRDFSKVGIAEGAAEVVGELVEIAVFDPEVRSSLSEGEVAELAPFVAEKYGRELSIAFLAGQGVGGAAGAVGGGVQQARVNNQRRMDVETLAEAAREGGLDVDVLEAATRDPAMVPVLAQGAREVGAARAEVERARQLIAAAESTGDADLMKAGQDRLKTAVSNAEKAYDSVIPKLGGLDRSQVKAKAQIEVDRARDTLRGTKVLPDATIDSLSGAAARQYADRITSASSRVESARTALSGPEGFDSVKREALQKQLTKAEADYQNAVDDIAIRSGAKSEDAIKADRESRDYNSAIDRQYDRKFQPLIEKGDTAAVKAEAERILKAEKKGKNKGLEARLKKLNRDLDNASTSAQMDAIQKDIAEVQGRMGREAPIVAAAKRAIQAVDPQQGAGTTQGTSPVEPTPTPDPEATPDTGTAPPVEPVVAPTVEPATAVTPEPETTPEPVTVSPAPVVTPPVDPTPVPSSAPPDGTVTPPVGSPAGGTTTTDPDGTQRTVRPDGSNLTVYPDGASIETSPDGVTTRIAPDRKTQIVDKPDGSRVLTRPDGSVFAKNPDGSTVDVAVDGTTTITTKNGTVRKVDPPAAPAKGTPIKRAPEPKPEPATPPKKPAAKKRKPGVRYDPAMVTTRSGWTDMLPSFNRTKSTVAIAKKWILEQEKKKNVEYIVAFNTKTGEVYGAGTIGEKNSVSFTDAMMNALKAGEPVTAVHNHPSGSSLSPQDMTLLFMYPGELNVVAVTNRGITFTASAKKKGRDIISPRSTGKLKEALSGTSNKVNDIVVAAMLRDGEITMQQAMDEKVRLDIWRGVTRSVNRTFGNLGVIRYTESNPGVASVLEILANERANKVARKTIRDTFALHGARFESEGIGNGIPTVHGSSAIRPAGSPVDGATGGDPGAIGNQRGGDPDGFAEGGTGGRSVGSGQEGVTRRPYAFQRLDGLPDRSPGPNQRLARAATRYMKAAGIEPRRQASYVQVDQARAERIAQAYADMKHDPQDPKVKAAYEALARETEAQYEALIESGMQIELIPDNMPDPYPAGPKEVLDDMIKNNHLWVFPTDSGYGQTEITAQDVADNPLLAMSQYRDVNGKPMRVNDLFRAVHDAFGHGREGVGFGPAGEENTWQSHVRMFSPEAARAMTSETRGQNSWVNYGPYGEQNRADPRNTVYAEQKIGLLPDWAMEEGVADQAVSTEMDMLFAENEEARADREAEIERLMQTEGPVRLVQKGGGYSAVITQSTYGAPWRMTRLDDKGPMGHSDYSSREAALRDAIHVEKLVATDANSQIDPETGLAESQSMPAIEEIMPVFKKALAQAESDIEVPGWLDIRTENGRAYQDMLDRAKTPVSTTAAIFKWIETQGINAFAPIRDLEISMRGKLGTGMDSAFKAAEIAVNDAGRNESLMNYGAARLGKNGEYAIAEGTIGIRQMLAKLGQGQAVVDWMEYMGARRAQEIRDKGFKTPLTDEDIAAGLAKETPVFKEVAADWKKFNDANVDFIVASGRISKAMGQALKDDAAYVPFYRTDTGVNSTPDLAAEAEMIAAARAQPKIGTQVLSRNPGIRKLKGDDTLKVNNLIENMIRNSQAIVAAGMRNQAANKVFDLLSEAGMVEVQRAREKNKKGKYIQRAMPDSAVRMWKDGHESYIVPLTRDAQPMMIALGGLQPVRLSGIADAMAKIGSFFRQSITLTPAFIVRNMIRDVVSTGVLFNGRNLTMSNNALTGFRSSLRNSASRAVYTTTTGMGDFRFGGGDIGLGRNDLMVELGIQPKTLGYKFRQLVGKMEEYGTASELANRIAVFESLKESGVRSDEAAYQALTIVNYGRRGANHALRTLLPMVPFLNARIQGLARMYEPAVTLRGNERKAALAQLALSGAVLSVFSGAVWAWNNMDEERREKFEAEPLHRRLNYHMVYVGDRKILIPKAFEIGTLFSTIPEFAMEAMIQGDTDEIGAATIMTLTNTFGFNPIPAAMLPAIEVLMDYNMFTGRPIEGPRLQQMMREDRVNPQTAALAVGLSRSGLGDFTGLSPVNMDHLLNGYGGIAYQMLATMVDTIGGDLGLLPERPDGVFGNMPVITPALEGTFRSMFKDGDADPSNRYVEDFYAMRQSITQIYRSAKAAAESGDVDRARDLLASAPATPAAYRLVNRANTRLGEINSLMRRIRSSPTMSGADKRDALSKLINERNRISSEVTKLIRQAEENQGTSFRRAAA